MKKNYATYQPARVLVGIFHTNGCSLKKHQILVEHPKVEECFNIMSTKRKLVNVGVARLLWFGKAEQKRKQLPCNSKKFVSNAALRSSTKIAEGYNLSSTPPTTERRIVLARKARAQHVYHAVLQVLKAKHLYQDLRKQHKSIVVLGYLQDITGFMQARLDGNTTFLPLGVTNKRWSYYLNHTFVKCAVTVPL